MKADEEEIRGVHDVRPKSKQLSIAGALVSFTLYDRKHKEGGNYWMGYVVVKGMVEELKQLVKIFFGFSFIRWQYWWQQGTEDLQVILFIIMLKSYLNLLTLELLWCYYCIIILLAPCKQIHSSNSVESYQWQLLTGKKRMKNALHFVCITKRCCLQAAITEMLLHYSFWINNINAGNFLT